MIILYLFESLKVFEVRHLYSKYFEFYMTLATQEARAILDEFIISIKPAALFF